MKTWRSGEVNVYSGSSSLVISLPGLAALAGATAARLSPTTIPILNNRLAAMPYPVVKIGHWTNEGVPRFSALSIEMDKAAVFRQIRPSLRRESSVAGNCDLKIEQKYNWINVLFHFPERGDG
jgi:hypothetical protein